MRLLCWSVTLLPAWFQSCSSQVAAKAKFLKDNVPFGFTSKGFLLPPDYLEEHILNLTDIRSVPLVTKTALSSFGVELLDLSAELGQEGIEENCNVSSREVRLTIGQVLLKAVGRRFGRRAIHAHDLSVDLEYSEAYVNNFSGGEHEAEPGVFHADKVWGGIAELTGSPSLSKALELTLDAQWTGQAGGDFEQSISPKQFLRLVAEQAPGLLNIWLSLTPGQIQQWPLVLLLNAENAMSLIARATAEGSLKGAVNTYWTQFQGQNDTISAIRSSVARDTSHSWGFVPDMSFGEALLFYADRTPHGTTALGQLPEQRISAEMQVLVTNEPLTCRETECEGKEAVKVRRL
mmetsp:Transcript_40454/g.72701  ORF Transcript_40454/g.72701 Transcript_40454/m.72701 type:complete len:348 (-) Transcript_40454:128-1171(-)